MAFYIRLVLYVFLLALIVDAVLRFKREKGTLKQRLLAVGRNSVTVLMSRITYVGGIGFDALLSLAEFLNAPGITSALTTYLDTRVVGFIMVGVACLFEIGRRRTLKNEPPPTVVTVPDDEK